MPETLGPARVVEQESSVADGLRLVHKQYASDLRMGRHAHEEWRFCLALKGSYTDSWRRGQRTRTPRQVSLHPAGEVHTTQFHTRATCFHVEFTRRWRERLLGDEGMSAEPHEFLAGRIPLLVEQIYSEFHNFEVCSSLVIEGLACELIGWTRRGLATETHAGAEWLFQARDYLHDQFREPIGLADVALAVQVHPTQLAREFKRRFHCSVGEYVRRLRVDFVCRHLPGKTPLADLALQAGFADQSHLTRVFKRITGRTPRQFGTR